MAQAEAEAVSMSDFERDLQNLVEKDARVVLENGPNVNGVPNEHMYLSYETLRKANPNLPSNAEIEALIDEVLLRHVGGIKGYHANERTPEHLPVIGAATAGFGVRHDPQHGNVIGPYAWSLLRRNYTAEWLAFKRCIPDRALEFEANAATLAARGIFPIPGTCFFQLFMKRMVNSTSRLGVVELKGRAHKDDKDGSIAWHRSLFEENGGIFGFPEHRVGYRMRSGDAIVFNPHAFHCYYRKIGSQSQPQRRFITFYTHQKLFDKKLDKVKLQSWPKYGHVRDTVRRARTDLSRLKQLVNYA
eukprot:7678535-Pyramimonas_sp.AAC.1